MDIKNKNPYAPSEGGDINYPKWYKETKSNNDEEHFQDSTPRNQQVVFFDSSPVTMKEPENLSSPGFFNRYRTYLGIGLIIFLVVSIVALSTLGFEYYDKYYKKVALPNILPANAGLVAKITIDPNSNQFKLLEENMEKFPGYGILKKDLDEAGEGKTLSQVLQDKLKKENLDFQNDIKPAIGEKAYIVIPDINPIGENLQNDIKFAGRNIQNYYRKLAYGEDGDKYLALEQDNSDPQVLGQYRDYSITEEEKAKIKPSDLIIAAEIKDLEKAKEVMEKMKKDNKYEITQHKLNSYIYYKVKLKEDNLEDQFFNYTETFHAFLGHNWVMASKEDDLKNMISRRKQGHFLKSIFRKNKNESALIGDNNYQKVNSDLSNREEEYLASFYVKLNFDQFFRDKNCPESSCEDIADYIKYPEDLIYGFLIKLEPDGVVLKTDSNQTSFDGYENSPESSSLANKLPEKVGEKWSDIFFEYNNLKGLYYNFKKNNVTDKGLEEWNGVLDDIKSSTGLEVERDFIDLVSGNLAFVGLTKKGMEPSGALIVEINDKEKMLATMKKIVEFIKAEQINMYSSFSTLSDPNSSYYKNLSPQLKKEMAEREKKKKELVEQIKQSQLKEIDTSGGKVYSYEILTDTSNSLVNMNLAINFSLENNQFVLGSNFETVSSLASELKNDSGSKLSGSDYYKKAVKHNYRETYTSAYLNTMGIWNSVEYFLTSLEKSQKEAEQKVCDSMKNQPNTTYRSPYCDGGEPEYQKKMRDQVFAVGAIIRTVKVMGVCESIAENYSKSSLYLNIEELPGGEKERAEKILEGM